MADADRIEVTNTVWAKVLEITAERNELKVLLARHHGGQDGCAVCGWNLDKENAHA